MTTGNKISCNKTWTSIFPFKLKPIHFERLSPRGWVPLGAKASLLRATTPDCWRPGLSRRTVLNDYAKECD